MPLQSVKLKSGVNRENTRYTTEGGWYDCDKIRFRQGTPEKIGGWERISPYTFLGTCRSLWTWVTLGFAKLIGVGTNLKFYISRGGEYYDVTPIRDTVTLTNPFSTTNTFTTVTVTDAAHGAETGDFVTYSGATTVGGLDLNGEYQITVIDNATYTIEAATQASSTATGGGTVTAAYQVNTGSANVLPLTGWGAGPWGFGPWGVGQPSTESLRVWNQNNFGEDLIFGPRGGGMYYWDATTGVNTRGFLLSSLPGASDVPLMQNLLLVSDISRFVIAFGVNDYGSLVQNPMLIRWSDQEDPANWTPAATNQAGSVTLSHGSQIISYIQSRQEVVVFTDTSVYSLQYLGPPIIWGSTLLADNISIISDRAAVNVAGVVYWMGVDKFYMYDGRVNTLTCDLRQFVFGNFNELQSEQVFASTVERYNEVWWFYCSADAMSIDRYVVYNYMEKVWYYGSLERTAWVDAGIIGQYPIAAGGDRLVYHEYGTNDVYTGDAAAIESYITSSEFDIGDGHNFGFVYRLVPDITFRGSETENPSVDFTLLPLQSSGSGYNNPQSVGGSSTQPVVRSATVPIEQYTGQVYIRVRGRQMSIKVASSGLGVQWQLGTPRIDIRPDGRR